MSKIHLISRIDLIKNNWWLWEAERENPDGSMTHGTAQADGGGHMPEAFDPDDETAEEGRRKP